MTKEILKKAFEFLRSTGNIHTQKDLANAMNYNVASISRAFSGDKRYLTKDFLISLNRTFGNVFNSNWLMTGEGEMLEEQDNAETNQLKGSHLIDEKLLWEIIRDYQANNRILLEELKRIREENSHLRTCLERKKE